MLRLETRFRRLQLWFQLVLKLGPVLQLQLQLVLKLPDTCLESPLYSYYLPTTD